MLAHILLLAISPPSPRSMCVGKVLSRDHAAVLEMKWPADAFVRAPTLGVYMGMRTTDLSTCLAVWRRWPRAPVWMHQCPIEDRMVLTIDQPEAVALGVPTRVEVRMSHAFRLDALQIPAQGVERSAGRTELRRDVALRMMQALSKAHQDVWTLQCTTRGLVCVRTGDEEGCVFPVRRVRMRRSSLCPTVQTKVNNLVKLTQVLQRGSASVLVGLTPHKPLAIEMSCKYMGRMRFFQAPRLDVDSNAETDSDTGVEAANT